MGQDRWYIYSSDIDSNKKGLEFNNFKPFVCRGKLHSNLPNLRNLYLSTGPISFATPPGRKAVNIYLLTVMGIAAFAASIAGLPEPMVKSDRSS